MRRRLIVAAAALLALGSCQLTLVAFTAPPTTPVGQVFALTVSFTANTAPGLGGGVLQVPNGFSIASVQPPNGALVRDEPALIGMYTAEPGHYLASWSLGQQASIGLATYRVYVRAPLTATTATFKVALAGRPTSQPWQANAPAGVTDFAQITAAPHVQSVAVVAIPTTDFAIDAIGLPYATVSTVTGVALRDIDGDGRDDVLAPSRAFVRGAASWTETSAGLSWANGSVKVAAGDFDGDGHQDLVNGTGQVFFGNGAGVWTPGPLLTSGVNTLGVATGDFDGDGRDDIAFGGYYQNHVRVVRGNGNRTFTDASTGLPSLPNLGGQEVLFRDVTGDGHLDVVWHEVWAGNGQGAWTGSTGLVGNTAWGVDSGDLDGDGTAELVHANQGYGVAIHRHLGNNAWALVTTIAPPGRSISSVAVLDYDRDGQNDLAVGYYDSINGIEIWRNLGGMTFAPVAGTGLPASTATYVTDLAVGDVNDDTFPDLAVSFFGEGLCVFQNWRGGLSPFGAGCAAAAASPPTITGTSAPTLGNLGFGVRIGGGQPSAPALVWFGTSRRSWGPLPLPFGLGPIGAPGCTLWTGGEAIELGASDAAGSFTAPLPIPNVPALLRQTFFAQGAIWAPGSNPLEFVFSEGLALRLL